MVVRGTEDEEVFRISELDLHLFHEGTHYRLHDKLGAHLIHSDRGSAAHFAVWAPNASAVSVVGDFNEWNEETHLLVRGPSGVWTATVPNVRESAPYRFCVRSAHRNAPVLKADPFGFFQEPPLRTASLVWDLHYDWQDADWMRRRAERSAVDKPVSIYEVHLGSWMRVPEDQNRHLTYREIAP